MSAADEVDALAARIEQIDELGAGDDATYGTDQWGLGAVLKQLINSADVEGVRRHLELIDYHDEAVSAHHLGVAARLPFSVQYGDAAQLARAREVPYHNATPRRHPRRRPSKARSRGSRTRPSLSRR